MEIMAWMCKSGDSSQRYGFDILYLVRFYHLHKHLYPKGQPCSIFLAIFLVAISGLEQYLVFEIGMIAGAYQKVFVSKDLEGFKLHTLKSLILILAISLVKSVRVFTTKALTVQWRRTLTRSLHHKYFQKFLYYDLNVVSSFSKTGINAINMDNPDQRIASDASTLCSVYGTLIADLIVIPCAIVYYTYSAYSRTGKARY